MARQNTSESDLLLGEQEDPFNIEYSFEITEDGEFINFGSEEIPLSEYSSDPAFLDDPSTVPDLPEEPLERLSPILKERLAKLPDDAPEIQRVSISFENDVEIPRFAQAVENEPEDSPANARVLARNNELISQIERARQPDYDRLIPQLEKAGAKIIGTSWLTGGITVELPLQSIPALLKIDDLLYVTSSDETSPPPITVAQGRATINSDSFYNLGAPVNNGGMIALLDTGVRESHTLISQGSYSRIRDQFKCFGASPCVTQLSTPSVDPCNHGTSSAAIMSGNTTNNALRGVTGIGVDVYAVYPQVAGCGLDTDGAEEAFRRAVARGHKVIVAEMQAQVAPTSELTIAANNAFNSGAVVIAANGNDPQAGITDVGAPANGARVIGVGINGGGHQVGPVQGRNKPDILAPSYAVTASSLSDTGTRTFSGTSGATPFVGGVAAMIRNYFQNNLGVSEPGYTYAYLINSGLPIHGC